MNELKKLKDLTKSKLKDFHTCETLFYLNEYHKNLKEEWSDKTQQTFDTGRLIENMARTQFCLSIKLFKDITDKDASLMKSLSTIISKQIRSENDIKSVLLENNNSLSLLGEIVSAMDLVVEVLDKDNESKRKSTELYLSQGKVVIFEASFKGEKYLTHVQADILVKNEDGTYDAIELKSGGAKKAIAEYTLDLTIQYGVLTRQSSIKINKVYLWAINTASNMTDDLFTTFDMNEICINNQKEFISIEAQARETQAKNEIPKPVFKTECSDCPFFNTHCGKNIVDNKKSVYNLPGFRAKWDLLNSGKMEVDQSFFDKAPEFKTQKEEKDFLKLNQHIAYTQKNENIVKSVLDDVRYVNKKGLKEDLQKWIFPLRFFDFEAFMDAVPLFKNSRPYEAVVTQFSCHQLNKESSDVNDLIHSEWLFTETSSPKKEATEAIIKALGTEGSIVSYNKTYEETRIKDLIKEFPEQKEVLESLISRFVDLKDLIEDNVYDPNFMGSYSLKKVSPALLDIENGCYNDVELKSGANYNSAYLEMINTEDEERRSFLKSDMKKYCYYDTLNLFLIYRWILNEISKGE